GHARKAPARDLAAGRPHPAAHRHGDDRRRRSGSSMKREQGMGVALFAMCLALYVSNPDFLGASNAINTLRQISMLGIFAIGIGFVIVTGGIDLSVGSVVGLTGVIIA